MKIIVPEKIVYIPDGERCIRWDKTRSQKTTCKYFKEEIDYISDRDAQHSGLGVTGGSIKHYYCKLFDKYLYDKKYGYGVKKCKECLNASN